MGSTRFPNKVMQPIGDTPMIGVLLERLSAADRIDEIVLATSNDAANESLAKYVSSIGYAVYRGSENDVLDRYYVAAKKFSAEAVVRITGDCPLIDPGVVDAVITRFLDSGVELNRGNVIPFDVGAEADAVFAVADYLTGPQFSVRERMIEIEIGFAPGRKFSEGPLEMHGVPANVRHAYHRCGMQTFDFSADPGKTGLVRRFLAAITQQLHADTDSKERLPEIKYPPLQARCNPARFQSLGAETESSDSRQHEVRAPFHITFRVDPDNVSAYVFEGIFKRANVAGLIIYDPNSAVPARHTHQLASRFPFLARQRLMTCSASTRRVE